MRYLTFISILVLAVALTSCNSDSGNKKTQAAQYDISCVERIMMVDDSLATIRNQACESISLTEAIQNYVADMRSQDFESCPQLFSQFFKQHLDAWNGMIPLTDNYAYLRGEMYGLFDEIKAGQDSTVFNQRLKAVTDTWEVIEHMAK